MTFRVSKDPRCPGCCVILAGVVITFNEGWAWCPVCTNQALHLQTHLRYVMQQDVMQRSAIMSHGLRFYVPNLVEGVYLNALDEYERLIAEPEPSLPAIAAWPGFNLVQLPTTVRDRDSNRVQHYCRRVAIPHGYEVAGITDDGRPVLVEIKTV